MLWREVTGPMPSSGAGVSPANPAAVSPAGSVAWRGETRGQLTGEDACATLTDQP
jgi:hypothetical protein